MGNIFKIKRRNALAGAAAFDPTRVNLSQSGGSDNGYKTGDKVMYQGNYYVATLNNDAIPPTDGLGVYWSLIGPALGAPATIAHGELAFNEVGEAFYYGKASNASSSIGGKGEFLDKSTSQTVVGDKTFSNTVVLSSAVTVTQVTTAANTYVATTEFVQNVFAVLDGGNFDDAGGGGGGGNNTPVTGAYYYSASSNDWYTVSNWWGDNAHTQQATTLPLSSTNVVIVNGSVEPLVSLDNVSWVQPASINSGSVGITFTSQNFGNVTCSISGEATFEGNSTYNV